MDIEQLKQCRKCEKMGRTRKCPVQPRGNPHPSIVVVGQAPGKKENDECEPFVGPAGQLLDELLEIIVGVDLSDVYYTNAVKCYPGKKGHSGGDRKPTMQEINNCSDTWLKQELQELRADFVLVLGEVALKAVADNKELKDVHRKELQRDCLRDYLRESICGKIIPIYHPSVHNAEHALNLVKDLKEVHRLRQQMRNPPTLADS